jgi:hypothetical protein
VEEQSIRPTTPAPSSTSIIVKVSGGGDDGGLLEEALHGAGVRGWRGEHMKAGSYLANRAKPCHIHTLRYLIIP